MEMRTKSNNLIVFGNTEALNYFWRRQDYGWKMMMNRKGAEFSWRRRAAWLLGKVPRGKRPLSWRGS